MVTPRRSSKAGLMREGRIPVTTTITATCRWSNSNGHTKAVFKSRTYARGAHTSHYNHHRNLSVVKLQWSHQGGLQKQDLCERGAYQSLQPSPQPVGGQTPMVTPRRSSKAGLMREGRIP